MRDLTRRDDDRGDGLHEVKRDKRLDQISMLESRVRRQQGLLDEFARALSELVYYSDGRWLSGMRDDSDVSHIIGDLLPPPGKDAA
jgi:hypothetical protein